MLGRGVVLGVGIWLWDRTGWGQEMRATLRNMSHVTTSMLIKERTKRVKSSMVLIQHREA